MDSEAITKYLTIPEKRPAYRRDRPHSDFLCPLAPAFPALPQNVNLPTSPALTLALSGTNCVTAASGQMEPITPEVDYRFEDTIAKQLERWFHVTHLDIEDPQLQSLIDSVPISSLGSKFLNQEHVIPHHLRYFS